TGEGLPVLADASHVFIAANPPVSGSDITAGHRAVIQMSLQRIDEFLVELRGVVVEIPEYISAKTRFEFIGARRARLHLYLRVAARDWAPVRFVHRFDLRYIDSIKQTLVFYITRFNLGCQGKAVDCSTPGVIRDQENFLV